MYDFLAATHVGWMSRIETSGSLVMSEECVPLGLHFRPRVAQVSLERAEERCAVHFDGQPHRMLDYLRSCVPLETVDQIQDAIELVTNGTQGDEPVIRGYKNRFAKPAESGYCDLKFRHSAPENGFISTGRFIHREFEVSTFFRGAEVAWLFRASLAAHLVRDRGLSGPAVIIADNFHRDDDESCHVVWGFDAREQASRYGKLRIMASLEELFDIPQCYGTLWADWIMFGIDACTFHDDYVGHSTPIIDALFVELPLARRESYVEMEKRLSLKKFALI